MNITMNQLPTRTWNRLSMNEARVSLEGTFENVKPLVLAQPKGCSFTEMGQDLGIRGELSSIMEDVAPCAAQSQGQMEEALVLHYHLQKGQALAKLCLEAPDHTHLKAVVVLTSENQGTFALQTEVKVGVNARAELYVAELLDPGARCLNHIAAHCDAQGKFSLVRLELGAKQLYSGVNVDLEGRESEFTSDIGYHVAEGQTMDMNYVSTHRGEKTNCTMEISGTLEEKACKTFRGTIDFQRGCAGAKGSENENVLLMAEECVNQTLPVILCQEEDVEGSHGASIGQLDDKVLFYLGSRGISQEEARRIMAEARIQAVCAKFPSELAQDLIHSYEAGRGDSHGEL